MKHVFLKILLFVVALVGFVFEVHALRCEDVFKSIPEKPLAEVELRTFDASKTLSQKIRDNAPHYWEFARVQGKKYFGKLAEHTGLVVGDTHPGNFIVSRLAGQMRFFIADIKDSGKGSFIYDISRLVLTTHAYLKGSVKLAQTADTILKAYHEGLAGKEYKVPKSIRWIFEETLQDYSKAELEYVHNKVKNSKFKTKPGVLEEISFKMTDPARFARLQKDIKKAVQESLPTAEVLDLAFRPRERGGSADMIRYWALVQVEGNYKILEFKEVSVPATAHFAHQPETVDRYNQIFHTFWQVQDPLYKLATLDGTSYFMRPKKSDVFRVKYRNQSKKDIEFGLQLAAYDAYYLGLLHARQTTDKSYLNALTKTHAAVVDSMRQYVKDYSSELVTSLDHLTGGH